MKKALSLFLALLMVLAVVPLSVLPVFASDAQNIEAAADTVDWNDMSAIEKTEAYKSLYVGGAKVVLMAYDAVGGQVTLDANGSGSWVNLVDGASIPLTGSLGAASSSTAEYSFGRNKLADNYLGYTVGKITYDGETPLYMAITDYYVADTQSGGLNNGNCKPVKINGGDVKFVSHEVYTTYKWVAEEGTTTYVKIQDYWEKRANGFKTDGSTWYDLSDDAISGGSKRTRVVEWTIDDVPADLTGWTVLEGGKFVEDTLSDFFGGWHIGANGGIQNVMSDANLISRTGNAAINLGKTYSPAYNSEYTIEIVTVTNPAIDTDNNGNTFGFNFNFDGEPNRLSVFTLGNLEQVWCVSTTAFSGATAMSNANYFHTDNLIGANGSANSASFNAAANSNGKFWTLTYDKVANGTLENGGETFNAFSYSYDIKYYNGSSYTQQSSNFYPKAAETKEGTRDLVLMRNVPNTTYAVRVYDFALTASQKNQNHFVDLLAYYGVDISALLAMTEEERAIVISILSGEYANVGIEQTSAAALKASIDTIDWDKIEATKRTNAYKSLYAPGATAIFLGYNAAFDGTVTLQNGSGTWTNLVAGGKDAAITGHVVTEWGGTKTYTAPAEGNTEEKFHTHYVFEYDENGTPIAVRVLNLYEEKGSATKKATQTITIDGVTHYLTKAESFYQNVVASNKPLYVKDLAVTANGTSYTTNGGDLTWTLISETEQEGYTSLGNYKISGNRSFTLGGWTAGKGVTTTYNDLYVMKTDSSKNRIDFGTMGDLFGRTDDYDYTLEIIADYTGFTDDDNYAYSLANTAWEGEGKWGYQGTNSGPTRIGRWVDCMHSTSPNRLTSGQGLYNVHVSYIQGDRTDALLSSDGSRVTSYNTRGVSGIHNYTYSKAADGNGSAVFAMMFDGAKMASLVPGTDLYKKDVNNQNVGSKVTTYEANDASARAYIMAGMAGTVYAVRAYTKKLSESELNQNHFIDLCGYYDVDVSTLVAMDDAQRAEALASLATTFASKTFNDTSKKELERAIHGFTAKKEAANYASLYVAGASVITMAYDEYGSQVSLTNGAGSWTNLVSGGENLTINAAKIQTSSSKVLGPGSYSWQNSATSFQNNVENNASYTKYTVGKITYAEDGVTPLYATETVLYLDPGSLKDTANRKMALNGTDYGIADMSYTTYKWVAAEGVTTYVKETKFYERQDGEGARHMLSDTKQDGYTERVHHVFTDKPTEGYDKVITGGYFEAAFIDSFGGWTADGKGISVELTDIMLQKNSWYRNGSAQIKIPVQYLPQDGIEYTLEIVAAPKQTTDTDGFGNTAGNEFNYQGEFARRTVNKIGLFEQYWGTYTTAGNKGVIRDQSYSVYDWGADAPTVDRTKGRSNQQYTVDASADAKVWTITYERVKDGEAFDILQRISYDGGNLADSVTIYNDIKPEVGAGTEFYVMNNVSGTTYAVRFYSSKALSAAERNQNHFVDLCAYHGADVSKLVELEGALREQVLSALAATFSNKSFESTSKEELDKEIEKVYKTLVSSVAERQKTEKLASLYVSGATGIFLAYNAANDGTILLENGSGAWINLVDNAKSATLTGTPGSFTSIDGAEHIRGWQLGDKSVGYKTTWQNVHTNNMEFSSDLLGNGDTTLEMVVRMDGVHVEAGGAIADYWDVDGSKDLNVGDKPQLWGSLVKGKNIYMYFKHTTIYDGVALPNTLPMGAIYSSYSANGDLVGNWNLKGNNENVANMSGVTANYVVTEKQLGEGKVNVNWQIFSNPATLNHQMLAGGKETDAFKTYGATTQLFNAVPTNVYAVRTYQKVLTEAERMQNHFVDLVFYTGAEIDVDAFAALPDVKKAIAYNEVKDLTMQNATKAAVEAAIDKAMSEDVEIRTVTFVADGVIVASVPFVVGAASITEPAVPAKEGYTAAWESYTLGDEDITVNAVYTVILPDASELLSCLGVSVRLSGAHNGLRTQYKIDLASVAKFEEAGYTVEIGALFGTAKYNGETVHSIDALTLEAINSNTANIAGELVYASDNDMGASFTYVEYAEGVSAIFAYTIDYQDNAETADAGIAKYLAEFVYRGYVRLTDPDGNVTVVYADPSESYRDGVSIYEIAETLVAEDEYADNTMLNAIITVVSVRTVTFVADGNVIGTVTYKVGDSSLASVPAVPQKTGYIGAWESYELNGENITVNAVYTLNSYTITYVDALGAANNNPTTYTSTESVAISDLSYVGYRFDGWYDANGVRVTSIQKGTTGDLTLTARWTKLLAVVFQYVDPTTGEFVQIDVQYLENGESAVAPDMTSFELPENYSFLEWNGSYENVTEDRYVFAVLKEGGDWTEELT